MNDVCDLFLTIFAFNELGLEFYVELRQLFAVTSLVGTAASFILLVAILIGFHITQQQSSNKQQDEKPKNQKKVY
jgi:hypothetical protein